MWGWNYFILIWVYFLILFLGSLLFYLVLKRRSRPGFDFLVSPYYWIWIGFFTLIYAVLNGFFGDSV